MMCSTHTEQWLAIDGFRPIYFSAPSASGPDREFLQIECIRCGHRLNANQRAWRMRHFFRCNAKVG